jgi:PAS domain S-box-containing protein
MLNYLLTALNDCVLAFDENTQKYLFISPSVYAVTEYDAKDFQDNKDLLTDIIEPTEYDEVLAASTESTSKWTEQTYHIKTRSGKIRRLRHKKCRLTDEQTGHQVLLSVINDVSEEQQVREEIAWTKNNLEALINNTQDMTWSINREGKYVYMNTAYRNRIAYTIGIVPKEGDDAYAHSGHTEEINQEWISYYHRALSGERYVTRHESPDPQTKEPTYFEVSFNPIYKTTKGEIIGVGCFARDITERLKNEKALIDQNDRLKNIASLSSHELRRPVASMLGLINIIDKNNFLNPDNEPIIEHLFTVSMEIDEVIRTIVNKTFIDGLHLTNTKV